MNYLWALATVDYNPGLAAVRAVVKALTARVSLCISQELANAVWACSKLNFYDDEFLKAYAEESVNRMDEFNGQNLVRRKELRFYFFISAFFGKRGI